MSDRRIVIIAGGEHARVIADALRAANQLALVVGYVDDKECEEMTRRFGIARLGGDADVPANAELHAILGFGGVHAAAPRGAAVRRLETRVQGWTTVAHPSAVIAVDALVGEGTVIFAGAIVNTGARIGRHCIVNTGAIVDHDVEIGDHAQIAPGVVIGGGAHIGQGAYVGLGARVRDHVEIGPGAIVGMGAVVVRNVPPAGTVVGVPAR